MAFKHLDFWHLEFGQWDCHAPACQALARLPKSYGEQAGRSLTMIPHTVYGVADTVFLLLMGY